MPFGDALGLHLRAVGRDFFGRNAFEFSSHGHYRLSIRDGAPARQTATDSRLGIAAVRRTACHAPIALWKENVAAVNELPPWNVRAHSMIGVGAARCQADPKGAEACRCRTASYPFAERLRQRSQAAVVPVVHVSGRV